MILGAIEALFESRFQIVHKNGNHIDIKANFETVC